MVASRGPPAGATRIGAALDDRRSIELIILAFTVDLQTLGSLIAKLFAGIAAAPYHTRRRRLTRNWARERVTEALTAATASAEGFPWRRASARRRASSDFASSTPSAGPAR